MEVEMEGGASVWPDSSSPKARTISSTFERSIILAQSTLCQRWIRGHHAHV